MDKFVGKRLDGRYEIQEIIGVGGMAVVYKAYDNVEDRIVAIKILKEEYSTNDEFLRRFKNESRAISMLSHPNIVKVFDVSFGDLIQYIVMEYIDGITLKEYIEQEGSLPWKNAVHFIIQVLRGLQHAHDKGIVHRDIKPQNIMVLRDGTIKVTDFGIARFARSEHKTITDKAIGSVHYISPEQARGETTDEKSDVYSVGVILYEMITGQLPFQAESAVSVAIMQLQRDPDLPSEINGSIPLGLEQITMHAMQKDASKRYKSAAEMLCDLDEFRKDPAATFEYNYFVDDSPTKFVANIDSATLDESPVEDEDDEQSLKSPIIPILAGVAGALVIALIVLAIIFVPKLFNSKDAIACPNFVGMTIDELQESKYMEQFDITVEWDYNDEYEYGKIFEQSPDAKGKKVKEGAKITVYASEGQKTVKVTDVYGMTEAMGVSSLKADKFKPSVETMPDENVDEGYIIKTSPAHGTSLYEGAEVIVYVSSGSPTVFVDYDKNVTGLYEEKARQLLESDGLTVDVEYIESDKPKGVVLKQTPDVSSTKQVGKGTTVTLTVSSGITSYSFKLNVNLPDDYKSETGYISLWIDNGRQLYSESDKMSFKDLDKYTFECTSNEKSMDFIVQLSSDGSSYDKFLSLTVDTTTGKYTVNREYSYPKKTAETQSTPQTSSNTSSN